MCAGVSVVDGVRVWRGIELVDQDEGFNGPCVVKCVSAREEGGATVEVPPSVLRWLWVGCRRSIWECVDKPVCRRPSPSADQRTFTEPSRAVRQTSLRANLQQP
ncbi:MAG: hypothetical protein V2I33_26450, partial [Kangiellaceae bacterium]|nr:hypothetical protein [Kangiellaceae bacterium]